MPKNMHRLNGGCLCARGWRTVACALCVVACNSAHTAHATRLFREEEKEAPSSKEGSNHHPTGACSTVTVHACLTPTGSNCRQGCMHPAVQPEYVHYMQYIAQQYIQQYNSTQPTHASSSSGMVEGTRCAAAYLAPVLGPPDPSIAPGDPPPITPPPNCPGIPRAALALSACCCSCSWCRRRCSPQLYVTRAKHASAARPKMVHRVGSRMRRAWLLGLLACGVAGCGGGKI